jgi:hypothetical protein
MLFYVAWRVRTGQGPEGLEAAWALFSRWEAPEGVEFKGMWQRPDGGGFGICEVASAEALYEATAPWSESYLDYDVVPIVEIQKAGEIAKKAAAFRAG